MIYNIHNINVFLLVLTILGRFLMDPDFSDPVPDSGRKFDPDPDQMARIRNTGIFSSKQFLNFFFFNYILNVLLKYCNMIFLLLLPSYCKIRLFLEMGSPQVILACAKHSIQ